MVRSIRSPASEEKTIVVSLRSSTAAEALPASAKNSDERGEQADSHAHSDERHC